MGVDCCVDEHDQDNDDSGIKQIRIYHNVTKI